jgi:hypothetical protein
MCFNYKVSLLTFFLGTIFSILLYKYGNKKYDKENKTSAIFLIFISAIQLMDFLFWIDINNKLGINKIITIFGPFLNVCQPIIFYLIKYIYFKPDILTFKNYNLPVAILNLLYFIFFLFWYIKFITNSKLITQPENGHLKWPWLKYINPYFYLILLAINIFYLYDSKYSIVLFTMVYFFFFLSIKLFNYHTAEIWCFFGCFIPLILYFLSYYI